MRVRALLIALLSGAMAGLVIGGIGSRIAMRIIADSVGRFPALTFDTVNVLIVGALLGVTGGLPFFVIRQLVPGSTLGRALVFSLCVFAVVTVPFFIQPPEDELAIAPQLGRVLFAILFAAYGISVPLIANALERVIPSAERYRNALRLTTIALLLPSIFGLIAMFVSLLGIPTE